MPWRKNFPDILKNLVQESSKEWQDRRRRITRPQGSFHPPFYIGNPSNSVVAILLGAFMIFGIQPGPLLISQHPDLFWGTIMSMYVGNAMLLILNLPLIGLWVKLLKVPYPILFPLILVFCLVGVYSLNNSLTEVAMMVGFGVFGYLGRKFQFEMAPLILALVIGPMMEQNLRLSLVISQGSRGFSWSIPYPRFS